MFGKIDRKNKKKIRSEHELHDTTKNSNAIIVEYIVTQVTT